MIARLRLLSLFFLAVPLSAGELTSADFLNIPVHARTLAQGEAAVADASGAGAAALNPAALAAVTSKEVSFTHGVLVEGSAFEQTAFAVNWRGHVLSVSHFQLSHGALERRDASGGLLGGFTPRDTVTSLGYGGNWGRWSYGGALKRVSSKIVREAETWTGDAGVKTAIRPDLDAGASVSNAFGELSHGGNSSSLPRVLRAGLHWGPAEALHLNTGAVRSSDGELRLDFGAEARFGSEGGLSWALRAGYNGGAGDLSGFSGLKGGFGASFRRLTLDYAVDPFGDFGLTHRWSVDYAW